MDYIINFFKKIKSTYHIYLIVSFIIISNGISYSIDNSYKNILAYDSGWTQEGFFNEGYGFGISYEREINRFLSLKLRHGVVVTEKQAVGKRVDILCYSADIIFNPFFDNLNSLNIGIGYGYALTTSTDKTNGLPLNHFLIPYIDTFLGYRFFISQLLLEPYINYIFPLADKHSADTGIAMYTSYVMIIGINIGFGF